MFFTVKAAVVVVVVVAVVAAAAAAAAVALAVGPYTNVKRFLITDLKNTNPAHS